MVRNSEASGVTVKISMSLDGAVVRIDTLHHDSPNLIGNQRVDEVRVEVEEGRTYYLHNGKAVTVADIALIVLKPILASLHG